MMLSPQPPYSYILLLALSVACTASPVQEYAQHSTVTMSCVLFHGMSGELQLSGFCPLFHLPSALFSPQANVKPGIIVWPPDGGAPILTRTQFEVSSGSSGLAEGEVLVRLEGATICNSDVHTLTGRRKVPSLTGVSRVTCHVQEPTPGVLGHEGCGEVVASARAEGCAGSRVTFSVTDVCGECEQCRAGPQQKCRAVMKARQYCQCTMINIIDCTISAQYGHTRHEAGGVARGCYSTHILLGRGTQLVQV